MSIEQFEEDCKSKTIEFVINNKFIDKEFGIVPKYGVFTCPEKKGDVLTALLIGQEIPKGKLDKSFPMNHDVVLMFKYLIEKYEVSNEFLSDFICGFDQNSLARSKHSSGYQSGKRIRQWCIDQNYLK